MVLLLYGLISAMITAARRRRKMSEWAERMEFQFQPRKDRQFMDLYPRLDALRRGDTGWFARNIVRGRYAERVVVCFDYHYAKSSGEDTKHYEFSAVIIETGHRMHPLLIRKEGVMDKVGQFVGFDDINFESAEFSRTFYVKCDDRRFAYDVINPEAMEHLLAQPGLTLHTDDARLLVLDDKLWSTEQFETALRHASRFLDLIPDDVVDDLGPRDR